MEMDDFVSWYSQENGWLDTESMGLTNLPGQGRGAVALRDIPEGHTLFTIPRSLTLSTRTSELPRLVGESAWKSFQLHKGWVGLILCMMWEESRGAESKWSGYLEILPKTFDTPMFWSEDELKELEGTAVLEKIGKEEAERDYREKLIPAINSRPDLFNLSHLPNYYSLENYHRMGSRILSRSFRVERWRGEGEEDENSSYSEVQGNTMDVDDNTDAVEARGGDEPENETTINDDDDEGDEEDMDDPSDVAMVPMADMLNARYGSENAKLFHELLELKMVTTRPIKKGEQIYNTYGDPPNSDLIRRYGHVDLISSPDADTAARREGNPADIVEIRADLVVDVLSSSSSDSRTSRKRVDINAKERIDWWLEEGGDDIFVIGTDHELPDALISFLKLLLLTQADWEETRTKSKPPKPKLDHDAKLHILPLILELMERRIANYPTTLEHDESLLSNGPSNIKFYNALVVRVGEKRILKGCTFKYKSLLEEARAAEDASLSNGRTGTAKAENGKDAADQKKRKRGTVVDGEEVKARKRVGR